MGALVFQTVSTPFVGGVETKITPHQVPPVKLLQLVNMVMAKKGAIQTRNGSTAQIANPLLTATNLSSYSNQLIAMGSSLSGASGLLGQQRSLSPADSAWTQVGQKQPIQVLKPQGIVGNIYDHGAADLGTALGVTVYAYEEYSGAPSVNVTVVDEATGNILLSNLILQVAAYDPRVVAQAASNTITVFYIFNNQLYAQVLTLPLAGTPTFSAKVQIVDGEGGNLISYEARAIPGATPYIAVVISKTAPNLYTLGWNPATQTNLIAPAAALATTANAHPGMWLLTSGATSYILIAQVPYGPSTNAITFAWYNLLLASPIGPYTLDTTAIGWGNITAVNTPGLPSAVHFFYEEGGQGPYGGNFANPPTVKAADAAFGGIASLPTVHLRGVALAGEAFAFSATQAAVPLVWPSAIQPTYFLMGAGGNILAKMQPQNAGGITVHYRCPTVATDPLGNSIFAYLPRTQATATYANNLDIIRAVQKCGLSFQAAPVTATLGKNLLLSGGHLATFDGQAFSEANFHLFPEMPTSGLYPGTLNANIPTEFPLSRGAMYGCPISAIRTTMGLPKGTAGAAVGEVTTVSLPPPQLSPDGTVFGTGWMIQPGSYFTFWLQSVSAADLMTPCYVWFQVDGVGADPALLSAWITGGGDATPQVFQAGILSSDTDIQILQKIQTALSATSSTWANPVAVNGTQGSCTLTITNGVDATAPGCPAACASDLLGILPIGAPPGAARAYSSSLITCPAGNRIMPGGYFVIPFLPFNSGSAVVFFQVDGVGSQPATPNLPDVAGVVGGVAYKEVVVTSSMTPSQVQAAILTALGAGSASTYQYGQFPGQSNDSQAPFILLNYNVAHDAYIPAYNVNASGWAIEANQGGDALGTVLGSVPGNGVPSVWYYQETFERYDAQGQIVRSAPSLGSPCFVNGAFQGLVNGQPTGGCLPRTLLPTCQLTDYPAAVSLAVYRSEINPTTVPVQYFRASAPVGLPATTGVLWSNVSPPGSPAPPPIQGPILNSATVDSVAYIDTVPDALLAGNPQEYTATSLANFSPPAPVAVATHRGRTFVVPSETPNMLWYSQTIIPGGGQVPAFNSLLTQAVDAAGGDVVGVCSMDSELIIAAQTRVYHMPGNGPDAFGQNSDYGAPVLLTADVGCIAPNSMVLTNVGVMFQSQKGIYLAGRDFSASYIGSPVESFVQGNIVTSAVLMPDRNEVRFGLNNGNIVVYQDLFQQWYVISGWGSTAVIWQGQYAFQGATGQASVETSGATTDAGTAISWTAQTAWIPFGGIQGYQRAARFFVLGASANPISVSAAFNYNPAFTDPPYTYTPNPANPEQFRAWIGQQLCESLSLTFTGTGVQMLEDLSLELGGIRGSMRLGPAQTGTGG